MLLDGTHLRLRVLLALALFLGAQWAMLAHETDLHAHDDGERCEVCLAGSGPGHAAIPASAMVPDIRSDTGAKPFSRSTPDLASRKDVLPPPRGPPAPFIS